VCYPDIQEEPLRVIPEEAGVAAEGYANEPEIGANIIM